MTDDSFEITYTLVFGPDRRTIAVTIPIDVRTVEHEPHNATPWPEWTALEVERCSVCPASMDGHAHCPAAQSLVECHQQFGDLISYEEVDVSVETAERTVTKTTSMQRALSSLIGLYMATCGCPILSKFKPMARFHLPFSSREETLFRTAGTYLIGQYLKVQEGGEPDFALAGLKRHYHDIQDVNVHLTRRIGEHSGGDANLNAITILDIFAKHMPWSIEDNLDELAHLFEPLLVEAPGD